MGIRKYGSMEIWKYGCMEIWKYKNTKNMEILKTEMGKQGNMEIR